MKVYCIAQQERKLILRALHGAWPDPGIQYTLLFTRWGGGEKQRAINDTKEKEGLLNQT